MKKFMCSLKNVKKTIKIGEYEQNILNGISLDICDGEFVVVFGPSGAGKSTMLNIISGLDKASSGEVICNGEKLHNASNKVLTKFKQEVGFVFQEYELIENLTVYENVAMMQVITKKPCDVMKILEQVGLEKHKNKFPSQLSGGEKQRVAIARALAKIPVILFCDEPTGALDEANGKMVLKLLQDLNQDGITVIVVTHLSGMAKMANHIIRIVDGKINEDTMNDDIVDAKDVCWA